MSYQAQAQLSGNSDWNIRNQAAAAEQARTYVNDARPDFVALANGVLRGDLEVLSAFVRSNAAAPGIADEADQGDGTVDQAAVADAEILAATQASWQSLAAAFYTEDGAPR